MKEIKRVLVANRGEIAVRIIKTLHKMGIEAVCIFSTADRDSLATQLADKSICVGESPSKYSYLNAENIISAALVSKCDAIHPGFGFLSEDSNFAEACIASNVIFIGPTPKNIFELGNKFQAKKTISEMKIPVIPGSSNELFNVKEAENAAQIIGLPAFLKAVAGGGGKGIRLIKNLDQLREEFMDAQREAVLSFGYEGMYLEKKIEGAKHIEVQLLSDKFGNVVVFPERDCSMQFHQQKFIEETPCVKITPKERNILNKRVTKIARRFRYLNTGTIEFLMTKDHQFLFMEMNTRIQVEHTITEMLTGVDFVEQQINISSGANIAHLNQEIDIKGSSMEVRINSVDSYCKFAPSCGVITSLILPNESNTLSNFRIDSGVRIGDTITPYYDSMIMKIVVAGDLRTKMISNLQTFLNKVVIEGVFTNIPFLKFVINQENFVEASYDIQSGGEMIDKFEESKKTSKTC